MEASWVAGILEAINALTAAMTLTRRVPSFRFNICVGCQHQGSGNTRWRAWHRTRLDGSSRHPSPTLRSVRAWVPWSGLSSMASSLGPDAIARELQKVGVHVKVPWVESCAEHLTTTTPGFGGLPLNKRVDLCYLQFLEADLNSAGAGCLGTLPGGDAGSADGPKPTSSCATTIAGRFVVQCDEIVNVGASFNERYDEHSANPKRVLKMALTDGVRNMTAYELRPIGALNVLAPAGGKIALTNPQVVDQKLMLGPENVTVLGGCVKDLEETRLRVLAKWQEPNRPGSGGNNSGSNQREREAEVRAAAWGGRSDAVRASEGRPPEGVPGVERVNPPNADPPESRTTPTRRPPNPSSVPVPPVVVAPIDMDDPEEVVDLTDEPVSEKEKTVGRGAKTPAPEVPAGRVKRKRAMVIDDSDDDPTPVRVAKKPTQSQQPSQSRFATESTLRESVPTSVPTSETVTRTEPTPKPPPQWASRLVRSEPFAYCAAVNAMRRAGGVGAGGVGAPSTSSTASNPKQPPSANVTLHGWFLDVDEATVLSAGGFEIHAKIHDGTGFLNCVVPSTLTLKMNDVESVSVFDSLSDTEQFKLKNWTRQYLTGFLGKVTLRVSTFSDGTDAATVLKLFGPKDFTDRRDIAKLGKRCEDLGKTVKGRKAKVAGDANKGKRQANDRAEKTPRKTRTSEGAQLARGA